MFFLGNGRQANLMGKEKGRPLPLKHCKTSDHFFEKYRYTNIDFNSIDELGGGESVVICQSYLISEEIGIGG